LSGGTLQLGILTVDATLTIRTWDGWLAAHAGITADEARGRSLADVVPAVRDRGLLPRFEAVLATGEVQVLASALHRYLIPCPPAAPSPHFDRMQQRVTLGPLRDGAHIVGVMVTIEDVTARLDAERTLAEQLRSRDPDVREQAARTIALAEAVEQPHVFAEALRADDWKVRRAAVHGLARHAHRDMLASLLRALREEHHDFNVLSSALQLLATSDVEVTAPLAELLAAGEADLRIQAALALGEQRHRSAIAPLIAALEDPDVNVRFHAIEALGRLRAADASDALADIAGREDFFLAFPAIDALAQINDGRVAPRLVPLLERDDLGDAVADALGEVGGAEVVRPLVGVLNARGHAMPIARALARLHERCERTYGGGAYVTDEFHAAVQPSGAQALLDAIEEASTQDLGPLVRVLSWLRGPAVERALTRLLGRAEVRAEVVEAIVRQDAGIVSLLLEQLDTADAETRVAAVTALGRLGDRRAAPALARLLDTDRETVLAVCAALASIGDPSAFESLLPLLAHADTTVRQAVIAALNSLGHPDMAARIRAMLDDPDPLLRESALRIAGYFGYAECIDLVISCCRDVDERVRRAAVEQLPYFDDERMLPALRAALADGAAKVRAAAAHALAHVDAATGRPLLVAALQDGDAWVRYYAARSLGALRDAAALDALAGAARGDRATHVRIAALEAIGAANAAGAADVLLPFADDAAAELAAAALRGLGQVDDDRALATLGLALRATDATRRLAAVAGLRAHGGGPAVEALAWTAGADADAAVSAAAADALSEIGRRADGDGDAAVRALLALSADPDRGAGAVAALARLPHARIPLVASGLAQAQPDVRLATVAALGRMRHPDASTAIRAALSDLDPRVRQSAVAVLDGLGVRGLARTFAQLARDDESRAVRRAAADALARQGVPPDADAAGRDGDR
jgi:HEAT repeat protein